MYVEVFIISVFLLLVLGFIICFLTSMAPGRKLVQDSAKPIECGFEGELKGARVSFSLHFFVLLILFLVFDIETILLFPAPELFNCYIDDFLFFGVIFFLFILLLGLVHEIRQGALK